MKKSIAYIITTLHLLMLTNIIYANVDYYVEAPENIEAGETFLVEITISKAKLGGFAKFETVFPSRFEVIGTECSGAVFISKNNKAKFIWIDLPGSDEFKITYNVKVIETYRGEMKLKHSFHYIEEREKKSINKEMIITVNNNKSEEELKDIKPLYVDEESIRKRILTDLQFNFNQPVVFRVQLAAFKNDNVPQIFLDELCESEFKLKKEKIDGLNKYYIGNFYSFETAEMFLKYSGVKDAFLYALKNGEKISVAEAKKITEK